MKRIGKQELRCCFCLNDEEEDMILLTKILLECVDGFENWGFDSLIRSKEGSEINPEIYAAVREVFKMTNFRRTLNDVMLAKYPGIDGCNHLAYVE